jgi:hypothetical protein
MAKEIIDLQSRALGNSSPPDTDTTKEDKGDADVAGILGGAAAIIGETGGIISLFTKGSNTNNTQNTQNTAPDNSPPPEEPKTNWTLIGGISVGFLLIIAFLISNKNGKPSTNLPHQ